MKTLELEKFDLEAMSRLLEQRSDAERALELEAQLLDLMSIVFLEVAYRAAGSRSAEQVKWFEYHLRQLHDRVELEAHVAWVADAQFQLLKLLASAAGSVAFTMVLNSFRSYLHSRASLELFSLETWRRLFSAIERKDVGRARMVFQRAFDRRAAAVLEQLARARGTSSGSGGSGAAGAVELIAWGEEP
jgi:DNA-binding GntR family transcriptional regulator